MSRPRLPALLSVVLAAVSVGCVSAGTPGPSPFPNAPRAFVRSTDTETAAALMLRPEFAQVYLDELERALKCASRTCHGPVRIALIHDGKTEGFVGGMA